MRRQASGGESLQSVSECGSEKTGKFTAEEQSTQRKSNSKPAAQKSRRPAIFTDKRLFSEVQEIMI